MGRRPGSELRISGLWGRGRVAGVSGICVVGSLITESGLGLTSWGHQHRKVCRFLKPEVVFVQFPQVFLELK